MFVSSEIHKDAHEDAMKEGVGGGALIETAICAETKLQSALAVHQKVVAYLAKPEAEQAISEHDTLTARLLAYLAEHDQAKQSEVASALSIVRHMTWMRAVGSRAMYKSLFRGALPRPPF